MARPRTFDADAALAAALRVFWSRTYRGASLEELTAVSGGSRPSLYAAFGDKRGLFDAAVRLYHDRFDAPALAALTDEPDGRTAVRAYLSGLARRFTDPDNPPGCLVAVHAAAAEAEPADAADEALYAFVLQSDAALHAALRVHRLAADGRAKADGHLPPDVPVGPLADHLHGVRHALSAAARAGRSERALRAMVDVALRCWP